MKKSEIMIAALGLLAAILGFTEFYFRGNEKVRIEQNILSTVYNLKMIWRNLEGGLERLKETGGRKPDRGESEKWFLAGFPDLFPDMIGC